MSDAGDARIQTAKFDPSGGLGVARAAFKDSRFDPLPFLHRFPEELTHARVLQGDGARWGSKVGGGRPDHQSREKDPTDHQHVAHTFVSRWPRRGSPASQKRACHGELGGRAIVADLRRRLVPEARPCRAAVSAATTEKLDRDPQPDAFTVSMLFRLVPAVSPLQLHPR